MFRCCSAHFSGQRAHIVKGAARGLVVCSSTWHAHTWPKHSQIMLARPIETGGPAGCRVAGLTRTRLDPAANTTKAHAPYRLSFGGWRHLWAPPCCRVWGRLRRAQAASAAELGLHCAAGALVVAPGAAPPPAPLLSPVGASASCMAHRRRLPRQQRPAAPPQRLWPAGRGGRSSAGCPALECPCRARGSIARAQPLPPVQPAARPPSRASAQPHPGPRPSQTHAPPPPCPLYRHAGPPHAAALAAVLIVALMPVDPSGKGRNWVPFADPSPAGHHQARGGGGGQGR